MNNELSFFETSELLEEIQRRFEAVVLLTTRRVTAESEDFQCHWRGGFSACLGLMERGKMTFARHVQKDLDIE